MEPRQIINIAKPTSTSTVTRAHCTPFTLPSMGVLSLGPSSYLTISTDVVFRPECTGLANNIIITNAAAPSSLTDFRDPFYASTLPQCYVLAACTVIAYMLVIMLLITPRTFLHEGAVVLGRRGFTNGPSGSDAGIGIGGRPWLQKVAALTVAISLTIATAVTFQVAERQYNDGYMDAQKLQSEVEDGQELKIIRVISDTFLWLAQAQTLIRLFPRQREKVIIKWTAFALITLDVLFSILNNFVYDGSSRPRSFVDAVPALSYLFQLALSLLYCAWVIYYSITKSRFAFSHPQMRNICLLAVLSLVAVLVPVVFFVLDISKPTLAGWGDYVRWVGAAAASVVVWEWVERIEALERNDKKDGVLGREVFDGDEMLEVTPSADSTRGQRKDEGNDGGGTATGSNGISWPGMAGLSTRYKHRPVQDVEVGEVTNGKTRRFGKRTVVPRPPLWPTRPPPAATPISRTDTASAESTVYAIRYHPISEATPPIHDTVQDPRISRSNSMEISDSISNHEQVNIDTNKPTVTESRTEAQGSSMTSVAKEQLYPWRALAKANPFREKVQAPPPEVSAHAVRSQAEPTSQGNYHRWDIRGRLEGFAATQADRIREKTRPNMLIEPLPLTVIPAPTRRRNLSTALEELEIDVEDNGDNNRTSQNQLNPWESLPSTAFSQSQTATEDNGHNFTQIARSKKQYIPNRSYRQSIAHRGSISFATTTLTDQDRRLRESSMAVSPVEKCEVDIEGSASRPIQIHNSTSRRQDGLPISVPAPPRRPRGEG